MPKSCEVARQQTSFYCIVLRYLNSSLIKTNTNRNKLFCLKYALNNVFEVHESNKVCILSLYCLHTHRHMHIAFTFIIPSKCGCCELSGLAGITGGTHGGYRTSNETPQPWLRVTSARQFTTTAPQGTLESAQGSPLTD